MILKDITLSIKLPRVIPGRGFQARGKRKNIKKLEREGVIYGR